MKRKGFNKISYKTINFLFIGLYIFIYILLNLKIIQLGYKIEKLRNVYDDLKLLNQVYNLKLTELLKPENLEKENIEKNINLENPKNWCFLEIRGKNEEIFPETSIAEGQTR